MNTVNKIFWITIFGSLIIGKVNAQCDSLKEATFDKNVQLQHAGVPQVMDPWEPSPPPDTNEVRRIYFIHGLGGSVSSWEKTAQACQYKYLRLDTIGFPARKCETTLLNYADRTRNLLGATKAIREEAGSIYFQAAADRDIGINHPTSPEANYLNPARAIIIAHSQGGLIARQLMHLDLVADTGNSTLKNGLNYGGVVTIASSVQGAAILANRHKILELANDGCNKLLLGPFYDVEKKVNINLNMGGFAGWVLSTFNVGDKLTTQVQSVLRKLLNNILPTVCDAATDNLMPMFFKQHYAGITEDYNPASPTNKINMLNSDTNSAKYRKFPKVSFYAVEPQDNIMWRTLNWMVTKEPNDADYFQANDDWELYYDMISPLINFYQSRSNQIYADYLVAYNDLTTSKYLDINKYYRKMDLERGGLAWKEGLDWFYNANESWQTIIGARVQNGNTVTYKPDNDGIVLAESAAGLPYAQKVIKIEATKKKGNFTLITGSSHMQVRNDEGIRKALKDLLDGKHGDWFYTAPQP